MWHGANKKATSLFAPLQVIDFSKRYLSNLCASKKLHVLLRVAIVVVGFAETGSISKAVAKRGGIRT